MDENDFQNLLNIVHAKKPFTPAQIKVLQAILDSDKAHYDNSCMEFSTLDDSDGRLCNLCHGSGEGLYDGSTCPYCGGGGIARAE